MAPTDENFLRFSVNKLRQLLERIEVCVNLLTEEQVWLRGSENDNAVGNLVLHLAGNVRQWIVSSLGEAPDHRDRASEFSARGGLSHPELLSRLRSSVEEALRVMEHLPPEKLTVIYEIQNHQVTGLDAIYHVVEHFALHTGQIIFVTKMFTSKQLGFYSYLDSQEQARKTS